MPKVLLLVLGSVVLLLAVLALVSGKAMAGSHGLQTHYYHRADEPLRFSCFVLLYLLGGALAVQHALG